MQLLCKLFIARANIISMIPDVYCGSWNVNALPEDLWTYVRTEYVGD